MWPRRKHYTPQQLTPKGNDRSVQILVERCFYLFKELLALMQASQVSADGKKSSSLFFLRKSCFLFCFSS
jgi:hypothetical protein